MDRLFSHKINKSTPVLVDTEKALDKTQDIFLTKPHNRMGTEGTSI